MNWYKKAKKDEQKEYFLERTKKHIDLVQKAAKKIVDKYPEFSELTKQVKKHDKNKFKEPELTPYVSLTWRKKPGNENIDNKELLSEEEENKITLYHLKSNSHHPEYHLKNKEDANIDEKDRNKSKKCVDASLMPDIDVAEMVSDWQAMSIELGKNTAREWFNEQKDVRWSFSKKQEDLIDKLLKTFDNDENI